LILPAVIASVDAFARSRRRTLPIGRRLRWALAAALPFALTLAAALAFRLIGWLPDSTSAALAPSTRPSAGESIPALIALGLLFALHWVILRPAAIGRAASLESDLIGRLTRPDPTVATALALLVSIEVL